MAWDIRREDPAFPLDPDELRRLYPVDSSARFWAWWHYVRDVLTRLELYRPILRRHIDRLKVQNVTYSEITIAAGSLPLDEPDVVTQVAALREWATQFEKGEIQIEFLAGIPRRWSAQRVAALGETILELYHAGSVVGVSLGGPEEGYPVRPFQRTFEVLRMAGLGIEIHAGEWCGPEAVWDALDHGHPDRIGHGVTLFSDRALIEHVREHEIHIEMCPTSNLRTGISRIEEHPVSQARDLGLSYSINTDDPGAFGCSMTSEYEMLSRACGFDEHDFRRVYARTLKARFASQLRVTA
jgi:adenosine deaminase